MKRFPSALTLMLAAGLSVSEVHAMDRVDNPNPNWFSLGPQFGLNIQTRFNYVGGAAPGPATGGGVNRTYDDGYVHVDSSGNAGGQTWNWGYQNASQVQGNNLVMHSGAANVNGDLNHDLPVGFDLAFGRDLGSAPGGKWGLQAAFDYTYVSVRSSQTFSGTGTAISDAYSLGTTIPPQAPYSGSFNGPGPLLGDSPTRTSAAEAVMITGSHSLDADVFALRLGPYYEAILAKRWSVRLGGGVALGVAHLDYSYNETVAVGPATTFNNAGSTSGEEFNAGAYAEGRLTFSVTDHTRLFAGAQYEYLGTFSRNAGNEQVQLDMDAAVFILFGFQWNF